MGVQQIFPCCVCGKPLALLPDCRPLLFHCGSGHWTSIEGLLRNWLPADRPRSTLYLDSWEHRAEVLTELAHQALANRHALTAADLQEAARTIEDRVRELRDLNRESRASVRSVGLALP
jgi:hypothetical protein